MRTFIVLVSAFAVASAGLVAGPQATQYHAQDELGQYSYGYAGGPSSKSETKTADGVVRGAYSYVDGHGLVQSVNYVADPVNGFRVAATNLPVGPAPAPAVLAAAPVAAPVAAVRAIAPAVHYAGVPAVHYAGVPAVHHLAHGPATYVAKAAPLNNGAVHVASLPIPPADTPEVAAARLAHFAARG